MINDKDICIQELKDKVRKFCEDRDWDQYHNPKDLAIGISTEANELLDIFRFASEKDMQDMLKDAVRREHIEEELADTLFFILRFAQMNKIDLSKSLEDKIAKNGKKYPVEKIKGKNSKYTEI